MKTKLKLTIFFLALLFGSALTVFFGAPPVRGTNTSIFTISVWVKPSGSAVSKAILGKAEELRIATNASSQPVCQIKSSAAWQTAATSSAAISVGSWSHVVCAYDLAYVRIYVNGVEKGSQALAVAADDTAAVWKIGRDDSASTPYGYFGGQVDEFKFYSSALTPDQIAIDMNQGKELQLGGQSSVTGATGQAAEYCVPGDATSCAGPVGEWKFDEKTGVTANDTSGGGKTGTLTNMESTDWKSASQCKQGSCVELDGSDEFVDVGAGPSSVKSVEFWIRPNTATEYLLDLNGTDYIWVNSGTVTAGGFNGNAIIYVNGQLSSFVSANAWSYISVTTAGAALNASDLDFGRLEGTDNLAGRIDLVKMFNYARTPAQVAWDYNRGKPVGWWKMDEGEGDKAYDSSGNGNTGTLTTMDPPNDWVAGKFGKALDFDGTSDYVATTNSMSLAKNSFSVSTWFKTSSSNDRKIISTGDTTHQLQVFNSHLRICVNNCTEGTTIINDNQWHFAIVEGDNTSIRAYLDGKSNPEITDSATSSTMTGNIRIGANGGTLGYYFPGQIDDVRVYNYALTAEQVKQVMNNGSVVRFGDQ